MTAPDVGVGLTDGRRSWNETVAAARHAESLGFASVALWDHPNAPGVDAPTGLAALAMVTSTVRLWANVLAAPYRVPTLLGRELASIDAVSGGRLICGLGTGWRADEFRAYGIPFKPKRARDADLVEVISILRALWANGRANYAGATWSLHEARCEPKPVQRPGPPIWIGSHGGERVLTEVVAPYADGCNLGIPSAAGAPPLEVTVARVRRACEAIGRDPDLVTLSTNVFVRGTRSTEGAIAYAADADRDRMLSIHSRAQMVDRIGRLGELGIRHVMLAVDSDAIEADLAALADMLVIGKPGQNRSRR